jgi:hypothetical protein
MRITPGYTFGTNEVPTRAKLENSLLGITLTGLSASQFPTDVRGLIITATSTPSMVAEGLLWRDGIGALWVNSRWGPVKMFRANWGGWETRRVTVGALSGTLPQPVGAGYGRVYNPGVGDTVASNVIFQNMLTVGAPYHHFFPLDTPVSGNYCRLLGRGANIVYHSSARAATAIDEIGEFQAGATGVNNLAFPCAANAYRIGLLFKAAARTAKSTSVRWTPGLAYMLE